MFLDYFQFEKQPFGATPDPSFLYEGASHREALASLYCAFHANRGFTTLIAEPGMGKTTLLFEFLNHVRAKSVFLFNTLCEPRELLSLILRDLEITPSSSPADQYGQLYDVLTEEGLKGRPFVLVIDEAQNLPIRTLEAVRLLSNFESTRTKLMQVVLSGQPQLADTLSLPEVSQLRQRISTVCHLDPLHASETSAYIEHRILKAGGKERNLFAPSAIEVIARASKGIPRTINTLCFNSLCLCRVRQERQVSRDMVEEAIRDLEFRVTKPPKPSLETTSIPISITPAVTATVREPSKSKVRKWLYAAAILIGACGGVGAVSYLTLSTQQAARSAQIDRNRDAEAPTLNSQRAVSAPVKKVARGTKQVTSAIVKVVDGDTLERIATNHLGTFNGAVLRDIRALNPGITDPNHIEAGRIIRLPGSDNAANSSASGRTEK